jgi:hypothetical protein
MKKQIALGLLLLLGMGTLGLSGRPAVAANEVSVDVDLALEQDNPSRIYATVSAVKGYPDGRVERFNDWIVYGLLDGQPPNNITGKILVWNAAVDPGETLVLTYSAMRWYGPNYDPGLAVADTFAGELMAAYPWAMWNDIHVASLRVEAQKILHDQALAHGWSEDEYDGSFNIVLYREPGGQLWELVDPLERLAYFLPDGRLTLGGVFFPGVDINSVRFPQGWHKV